ncbi:MAG: hypothetical protein OXH52_14545 [Gammaproteobacteria bacterium]|nr:hypothetical protein [Gammaproteobacteria bacterium]
MAIQSPLPRLEEDGSRLDWVDARYEVGIEMRGTQQVEISHRLHNAGSLERLIDLGTAKWVTEVRCPRTMFCALHHSAHAEQVLELRSDELLDPWFFLPGLLAVEDSSLEAVGLNGFAWDSSDNLDVPRGWWLARASVRSARPLSASLVRFTRQPALSPGEMGVEENHNGRTPFVVSLAADLYERRHDRDVQIAGLIAACALLPRSQFCAGGDNDESPVAAELCSRIEEAGLPDWDSDEFDPARTATLLERFHVSPPAEDEDG